MSYQPMKVWRSLNWPNRISIARLLFVPPFVVVLLNLQDWSWARYAALGIIVLMGLSDFIDGQLARRLNERTRLGALLDPLADKVLIISAVICLSFESAAGAFVLPNWLVVAVVGKDLWVIMGFFVVYLVTDRFRVHPEAFGKAATACQLLLVVTVLLVPELNAARDALGNTLAMWLCYIVVGLSIASIIGYTRIGLHYVHTEQKPLDAPRTHRSTRQHRGED
ncbi:MAG: CDP-alcohol phosphatidyltransferase family protein [Planctomycetota bacterium]